MLGNLSKVCDAEKILLEKVTWRKVGWASRDPGASKVGDTEKFYLRGQNFS